MNLQKCAKAHLQGKGAQDYTAEDGVPVDALKDVPLTVDLPGIDFVEELHHHKDVEDDGVVLRRRRVQRRVAAAVYVEELLPCEATLGKPRHFLSTSEEKSPTAAEERKLNEYPIVHIRTGKEQREDDDQLVHGVTQNVLHHGPGDEGLVTAIRFTQ